MIFYDLKEYSGYKFKSYKDALDCAQDIVEGQFADDEINEDEEVVFTIQKFEEDISEDDPLEETIVYLYPEETGDIADGRGELRVL